MKTLTIMKPLTKTVFALTMTLAAGLAQADERAPAIAAAAAGAAATSAMDAMRPLPSYPVTALRSGDRYGRVLLDYDVSADGSVQGVRVVEAYPMRVFTRTAVGAVKTWRHPVGESGTRTVEFTFSAD